MHREIMFLSCFAAASALSWAAPSAQIFTDRTSPQPVGTVIGVSVIPKDEGDPEKYGPLLRFRFSVAEQAGPFRIVRDFSRQPELSWRPELYEHDARIKVTVFNTKTKQTGETEMEFRITPRATGQNAVASPTSNPLVALFSFPACPDGSEFSAAYQRKGETVTRHTGLSPCHASHTSNLYVAGMRPDSEYTVRAEIVSGGRTQTGPAIPFRTGIVSGSFGRFAVSVPPGDEASKSEPFVLFLSPGRRNMASFATDTEGNLVWYLASPDWQTTRLLPGGRLLALGGDMKSIAKLDLVGNTLSETNITRMAEQMEAFGIKSICKTNGQQCVAGFHHDAIELPNRHIIAIGSLERVIPEGAQGSDDPVDIAGTMLFDLDEDMQVKWVWNSFDHLDLKRKSKGDGKCRGTNGGLACAPMFLTPAANDWLHGNAVSYVREDGNLTLSMPEQDWVIKIDYANGKGSGKVLWRLGDEGDFTVVSNQSEPWFSYQHDAAFEPPGSNMLVLLDNGDRRKEKEDKANKEKKDAKDNKDSQDKDKEPKTHSRGQVWKIDENARTATLVTNADLGFYAPFMGSAQRLKNGDYHFTGGAVVKDGMPTAKSIEVTPDGKIVYLLDAPGGSTYRSNRVADLYTPPNR
jgi:arylsulfate sulfotransferase